MEGWIKLYRNLLNRERYNDKNVKELFLHCLLKANHDDKKRQGILIKRGSFITSLQNLANELKLTIKQIRLALKKLESTLEVSTIRTNKRTVICVNKYTDYQDTGNQEGTQEDKQKTNKRQTKDKQRATTQEYKNNNNNNNNNKEIVKIDPPAPPKIIKQPNQMVQKIIDTIEKFVKLQGLLYESSKYERINARNLSRNKQILEICKKKNIDIEKFILTILGVAQTNDFRKNKITSVTLFQRHWVKIINLGIGKMSSSYSGDDIETI